MIAKSSQQRRRRHPMFGAGFVLAAMLVLSACQANHALKIAGHDDRGVPGKPLPACLTVLNWNVEKVHDQQISRDFSGLIGRHDPDLVFIQEARPGRLQSDELEGYFADSWSYPWPGGASTGVLSFARSSPFAAEAARSPWRELFVSTPKVSLLTRHALADGQTLLAVNVHLLNFESWNPFMLRAQINDLKERMAKHDGPIIVAGDFNTWSADRLAVVDELAEALDLDEVAFPAGRRTGDLHSRLLHGLFGIDRRMPLDRVYVRGFSVLSSDVLAVESSDHRPVLVGLSLDSRRPGRGSDCRELERRLAENAF